ncbi:hypothetical protein PPERSA_04258 [Pseudocohnilembus persalinus]|uniref:STOP protein n=1 Tax=Pseudocohnilembus persalinus TaxID=266149 RepID=A0A0V0QNC2_PSEPJ|nr:hypothetical protein PPERSA_04258 [Pseudocohnilembus persalinus]|eukprot:KRX03750.1 hypothetical protein PPERSA_04258 [Pseudocohnilembus persalinus]
MKSGVNQQQTNPFLQKNIRNSSMISSEKQKKINLQKGYSGEKNKYNSQISYSDNMSKYEYLSQNSFDISNQKHKKVIDKNSNKKHELYQKLKNAKNQMDSIEIEQFQDLNKLKQKQNKNNEEDSRKQQVINQIREKYDQQNKYQNNKSFDALSGLSVKSFQSRKLSLQNYQELNKKILKQKRSQTLTGQSEIDQNLRQSAYELLNEKQKPDKKRIIYRSINPEYNQNNFTSDDEVKKFYDYLGKQRNKISRQNYIEQKDISIPNNSNHQNQSFQKSETNQSQYSQLKKNEAEILSQSLNSSLNKGLNERLKNYNPEYILQQKQFYKLQSSKQTQLSGQDQSECKKSQHDDKMSLNAKMAFSHKKKKSMNDIMNESYQYSRDPVYNKTIKNQKSYNSVNNSFSNDTNTEMGQDISFCFSNNLDYLDNISIEDPMIKELFSDEILQNENFDVISLIEKNPEYFQHMLGNCACFKCTCLTCKCGYKIKYPTMNQTMTSYFTQFNKEQKPILNNGIIPKLDQQVHIEFAEKSLADKMNLTGNFNTTQKIDFHPKKYSKDLRKKPIEKLGEYPHIYSTQKDQQFADWKYYQNKIVPVKEFASTFGNKLANPRQTTYQKLIGDITQNEKGITANAKDVKDRQNHTTFLRCAQPDNKTKYQQDFQDKIYQLQVNRILRHQKKEREKNPGPNWQKAFQTTFNKDFDKKQDNVCNAKINSQKLINYLRKRKQLLEGRKQWDQIIEDMKTKQNINVAY